SRPMLEQPGGDKTLPASPLKRQRAREDGKVAKSQDLVAAGALLAALLALRLMGPASFNRLIGVMYYYLWSFPAKIQDLDSPQRFAIELMWVAAPIVLPFMLVMMLAGVLLNVMQVGILFTAKPLTPKLDKLNPISGLANLFTLRSFIELVKSILKVTLAVWIVWLTVKTRQGQFVNLMGLSPEALPAAIGGMIVTIWWRVAVAMLVLGLLDYGFQRWQYERDLMMTTQEAREELREFEGDPRIRQRVRQIQRQMAMQRMMGEVPRADVVITNPTQFAVALRYDPGSMRAPVVVAKGARILAERIRAIAVENDVPIVRKPELARTLYRTIDVNQPVPEDLFRAVAEVLAYVYQIDRREQKIRERSENWNSSPARA
ncbi:MAG: flagellar biosynthesis protein FlhB, partial [Candidatus Hydrogenedentes bacterium]|nr:flagellar biosynthesis protein FlhB [Candidatus Hydrogenedentota bacterium]